jgi:ABC-2 type transport system ATP-binding protein
MNTPDTPAIQVQHVTKKYKGIDALSDVSLTFDTASINGLFGKNGAGKTTLMSIITAQNFATTGSVKIFGEDPFRSERALAKMIFVRDNPKYPDSFTIKTVFQAAALFYPNWNQAWAMELSRRFELPLKRQIRKVSRGQLSAASVILGMASQTPIVFLDEPYLGLDASARQIFYDSLLEDFSENPRTFVLSSHLIDEISGIISRVVVLDHGKVVLDRDESSLNGYAFTITGDGDQIAEFTAGRRVLETRTLGRVVRAMVEGSLDKQGRARAQELGLAIGDVSLQDFIVHITQSENQPKADLKHLSPTAGSHGSANNGIEVRA